MRLAWVEIGNFNSQTIKIVSLIHCGVNVEFWNRVISKISPEKL